MYTLYNLLHVLFQYRPFGAHTGRKVDGGMRAATRLSKGLTALESQESLPERYLRCNRDPITHY